MTRAVKATLLLAIACIACGTLAPASMGVLTGCGASNRGKPTLPAPEYEDSEQGTGSDGGAQ